MPKKEFEDERVKEKQRRLDKKNRQALKKNKKQIKTALDNHRLGWKTRDGKEL